MKRIVLIIAAACMLLISSAVMSQDYRDVRIKKIPVRIQCWTYRNFTFFETLEKVEALGVGNVQAYRGQDLSKDMPGLKFGPELTNEQLKTVRRKLLDHGIRVTAYGVVGFDNNEESMRAVFDFAKKMGIGTIVTEPAYDDYSLIEKMVREDNIRERYSLILRGSTAGSASARIRATGCAPASIRLRRYGAWKAVSLMFT